MANKFRALAASEPHGKLQPFEFDPGELGPEEVEVEVDYCGLCHSDLSLLDNALGVTSYPFVPGHEVVGRVVAAGPEVHGLPGAPGTNPLGRTVGVGWFSRSCMACSQCLSGNHNLCPTVQPTIIGRHGGFANRIRAHWGWVIPLPDQLDITKAGPLFCGGVTVFNPIVQNRVLPTDRVGVIGIGGLGHLALQFLDKWGCEVYAFSSNPSKRDEVLGMGADHVINSRNPAELESISGKLDFLLSTVNANLDWNAMLSTLSPKGRLHFVGLVPDPIPVTAWSLIGAQKSISGTPLGSPATTATMLDFCSRHKIAPITEHFKMTEANEAIAHLEAGKARYRLVLKNDLV